MRRENAIQVKANFATRPVIAAVKNYVINFSKFT
jgi:hypothetical protein